MYRGLWTVPYENDLQYGAMLFTQALPSITCSWMNRPDAVRSPCQLSDEELFAAVAKGDEASFTVLVERHLSRVLVLASRMLGNSAEADDVAQETMLRVWTRGSLWNPGSAKFTTWLHRVAMNLCIDRLRRRTFQPLEDAEMIPDITSNPALDADRSELKRAVQTALDALPGKAKGSYHTVSL